MIKIFQQTLFTVNNLVDFDQIIDNCVQINCSFDNYDYNTVCFIFH